MLPTLRQMRTDAPTNPKPGLAIQRALAFCRAQALLVFLFSILLLIPCFWHRHIEAGDLASHTYNAWLAQLIVKGQAPGLYIAPRWSNVLLDVSLRHLGSLLGFAAAEKIIISLAALLFFWGAFSFLAVLAEKPPWALSPCIAMLAYGYAFNMGFINFYLSIGLACIVLAIVWHGGAGNWLSAAPFVLLSLLAHPIGFLWMASTLVYVFLRRQIPNPRRLLLPCLTFLALLAIHFYILRHPGFQASWPNSRFFMRNGSDQLILYGHRYALLSYVAILWGVLCFAMHLFSGLRGRELRGHSFRLLLEFYVIALCVTALLPENLRTSLYAGWIGLLDSRLTAISAILGLAVLNCLRPRKWVLAGFVACAAGFFVFLFQDTGTLNRIENNADRVVAALPAGTRVVPYINPPDDWRVQFIYHVVDRACLGRCFSFSNYEPASGEFRIRVRPGSPIVTSSSDEAEAMASGNYVVKPIDPPLIAIYQCHDADFTLLCAAPLQPGETVETPTLNSGE
jgi:hypothetical protein